MVKVKGKFHTITCHEDTEGEKRYSSTLSLTLEFDGGEWLTPRLDRCTPNSDPVPIVSPPTQFFRTVFSGGGILETGGDKLHLCVLQGLIVLQYRQLPI